MQISFIYGKYTRIWQIQIDLSYPCKVCTTIHIVHNIFRWWSICDIIYAWFVDKVFNMDVGMPDILLVDIINMSPQLHGHRWMIHNYSWHLCKPWLKIFTVTSLICEIALSWTSWQWWMEINSVIMTYILASILYVSLAISPTMLWRDENKSRAFLYTWKVNWLYNESYPTSWALNVSFSWVCGKSIQLCHDYLICI